MSSDSSIKTSTIIIASAATIVTGILAYAIYFDHKRQTDPQFRRKLEKESRKVARAAREEREAQGAQQKKEIQAAVDEAREEGFPSGVEEKEAYFMNEVGRGENLCQESSSSHIEAALCFYKALKVYPSPQDLISIYDKTIPKPVIDILAEMIAIDPSINIGGLGRSSGAGSAGSSGGIDD